MRRLERWLFAPGSAERLATLRIGLCAILAVRLNRGIYSALSSQPAALFRPRSFMSLLSSQPPRGVVIAAQVIGIAAAIAAVVGLRARVTLPVAWLAGLFLNGMVTSNGKVMHNDVMLLLAMVPLLVVPVSDAWSIDVRGRGAGPAGARVSLRYGWPVRTAMVVVAGGYFFSGFAKLHNSGISWVTSGNLRWVLYASSDSQSSANHLALFVADRAWLSHLFAAGALLLEISFPVVLFRRGLAPYFALGAVALHTGIWLTMGLDYWAWVGTALVVLIDWPAVLDRVRSGARAGAPATAT